MMDQAAIEAIAARCKFDPLRWSKVAFDWGYGELAGHDGPRAWQRKIFRCIRDHLVNPETRYDPLRISVASGHGIGKSAGMGMLSNWAMSCFADARVLITANTEPQLVTKTSPEVGLWFRRSITCEWFDLNSMSIKSRDPAHETSWRMDFLTWSETNTEAFAGLHNQGRIVLLLFDEASGIHDKVWEVALGALTDENTVLIWVAFGNPTVNTGMFRETFRKYRSQWVNFQIDSRTVEGTNKKYLQSIADAYGEDSDTTRIRVRGVFPRQSAMQFISEEDVSNAQKRHLRPEQYNFAPVIIGVDPAWTGDDSLEVFMRQGLYSKHLLTLPKNTNDFSVATVIAKFEDQYEADAVFVDMGYGTGIYSAGQTMGRSWRLVNFGEKSGTIGYLNKRAEMWGLMREWLMEGGAIDPQDQVLYTDLTSPQTVWHKAGLIQLESKQDMTKRGLPSPNRADALGLTFAFPVMRRKNRAAATANRDKLRDYDPLA